MLSQRTVSLLGCILIALTIHAQSNPCCESIFLEENEQVEFPLSPEQAGNNINCLNDVEEGLWLNFVGNGQSLDITFSWTGGAEIAIEVYEGPCHSLNQVFCSLLQQPNGSALRSINALLEHQLYYIYIGSQTPGISIEYTINAGVDQADGIVTKTIDISNNPIQYPADFRWNKESDLNWRTNQDILADTDEEIFLEVIDPQSNHSYELEIEPTPTFLYQQDTAFGFVYPDELSGRFRMIGNILTIERECQRFGMDTLCRKSGCLEIDTTDIEIPWYNIDIRDGGNIVFEETWHYQCEPDDYLENHVPFGTGAQFYSSLDDAIQNSNALGNSFQFLVPGENTFYARYEEGGQIIIQTLIISYEEVWLDPIDPIVVCEEEIDLCNYAQVFDPPLSPDPASMGWDVEFFDAPVHSGASPICLFDLPNEGIHTAYIRITSPLGCFYDDSFEIIRQPKARFDVSMNAPQCQGDAVILNFNFEGIPPFELAYQFDDGTTGTITSEEELFEEEVFLQDYTVENCLAVNQFNDNVSDDACAEISNSLPCVVAVMPERAEFNLVSEAVCPGDELPVQFTSTTTLYNIELEYGNNSHFIAEWEQGESLPGITATEATQVQIRSAENEAGCTVEIENGNILLPIAQLESVQLLNYECEPDRKYTATIAIQAVNQQVRINGQLVQPGQYVLEDLFSGDEQSLVVEGEFCGRESIEWSHECPCAEPDVSAASVLMCEGETFDLPYPNNVPQNWISEFILQDAQGATIMQAKMDGSEILSYQQEWIGEVLHLMYRMGPDQGDGSISPDDACYQELSETIAIEWVELPKPVIEYHEDQGMVELTARHDGSTSIDYQLRWQTIEDGARKFIHGEPALQLQGRGQVVVLEMIHQQTGCAREAEITLDDLRGIRPISEGWFIPNSFSPNNDGLNDRLEIHRTNPSVGLPVRFSIYNRFGQLVYDTKEFNTGAKMALWDGLVDGRPLNPQVLVWKLEIQENGQVQYAMGDLTLFK